MDKSCLYFNINESELIQKNYVLFQAHWTPSSFVQGFNPISKNSNVLSSSEWLLEKPQDFAENWLMVPCPKGVRMLVIAYKVSQIKLHTQPVS